MAKNRRCGNCGSTNLISSKENTLSLPWKDYPSVLITEENSLMTCKDCNEIVFSASQGKMIDELVLKSINSQINLFIKMIIQREKCEQKEIAEHIGVSPEYLSEIKSGRKTPKFQTFNFLKTLALDENSFKISSPNFKDWKTA
jgi:DNA-binding transcriptional regulator YiaG